jgi:hypothetical protein
MFSLIDGQGNATAGVGLSCFSHLTEAALLGPVVASCILVCA